MGKHKRMAEIKERKNKYGEKRYTVSIRIKGHPPVNKTFKRKTDAVEWANRTESQIRENINFPHRAIQRMTVGDLIDKFLANELPRKKPKIQKDFIKALTWYKNEIGSLLLSKLPTSSLVECRDKLANKNKEIPMKNGQVKVSNEKISPATVNRYMMYMRVVFAYAVSDLDILDINPMSKVKKLSEQNARKRYLNQQEISKLLKTCQEYSNELYICVLIALLTGARKSEILNLTWAVVDFEHKMFYFLNTKNGEDRGTPMHELLYTELLNFMKQSAVRKLKDDYVFKNSLGEPHEALIGKIFPKIVKQIGIEDFRFHDLRHTGASWQAMSGVSQPITQKTLGHKSPTMTNRYSHLRDENLRPTINEVGNVMLKDWIENT